MKEIWKQVNGWEKYYSVSNLGRVKTLRRKTVDKIGRTRIREEKILKPTTDRYGYLYVVFRKKPLTKTFKIHRLVASAFLGDSALQVNHKDLNKTNNRLDNLEYCTNSENLIHRRNKGPAYKKYYQKLSRKKVVQIKILILIGVPRHEVAKLFSIHPMSTYKIITGQSCHQSCRFAF